jgi:hypothetical protein
VCCIEPLTWPIPSFTLWPGFAGKGNHSLCWLFLLSICWWYHLLVLSTLGILKLLPWYPCVLWWFYWHLFFGPSLSLPLSYALLIRLSLRATLTDPEICCFGDFCVLGVFVVVTRVYLIHKLGLDLYKENWAVVNLSFRLHWTFD